MTPVFLAAFAITVAAEGSELDLNPDDRGNWTSGVIGVGELRGSKYGISSATYPTLDIAALTETDAQAIYARDFWALIQGDAMPPVVALTLFDAAVNSGRSVAVHWLQQVLGVGVDGVVGKVTLGALATWHDPVAMATALHQARGRYMIGLESWDIFRNGWENRLCALPFRVMAAVETLDHV